MEVGAGLYMYDVVVKSSRSLSSPEEFLYTLSSIPSAAQRMPMPFKTPHIVISLNILKPRTKTIIKIKLKLKLECGPMPNVMPNIGGVLC